MPVTQPELITKAKEKLVANGYLKDRNVLYDEMDYFVSGWFIDGKPDNDHYLDLLDVLLRKKVVKQMGTCKVLHKRTKLERESVDANFKDLVVAYVDYITGLITYLGFYGNDTSAIQKVLGEFKTIEPSGYSQAKADLNAALDDRWSHTEPIKAFSDHYPLKKTCLEIIITVPQRIVSLYDMCPICEEFNARLVEQAIKNGGWNPATTLIRFIAFFESSGGSTSITSTKFLKSGDFPALQKVRGQ